MPYADLEALRSRIDGIDARIIELLGERFAATDQVGEIKARHMLPPVDPGREEEQRRRFRALATERGISPELVLNLFREIIDEVVRRHRQIQFPEVLVRLDNAGGHESVE